MSPMSASTSDGTACSSCVPGLVSRRVAKHGAMKPGIRAPQCARQPRSYYCNVVRYDVLALKLRALPKHYVRSRTAATSLCHLTWVTSCRVISFSRVGMARAASETPRRQRMAKRATWRFRQLRQRPKARLRSWEERQTAAAVWWLQGSARRRKRRGSGNFADNPERASEAGYKGGQR